LIQAGKITNDRVDLRGGKNEEEKTTRYEEII
jgi:hypothetical protein